MDSVGGDFFVKVVRAMGDYYDTINNALISSTEGIAAPMLTLYLVFTGYKFMFNKADARDVAINLFIISCAYVLVYEGHFNSLIFEPIRSIALRGMTIVFNAAGGTGLGGYFTEIDAAFNGLFQSIKRLEDASDSWSFMTNAKVLFAMLVLVFVFGLNYIVFFVMVISSIVFFHIMMTVGGVVTFMAAFKPLRSMFSGWLKLCIFYALWPMFAAIVMGLMLKFLTDAANVMAKIDVASGEVFSDGYALSVLMGIVSLYVFAKIPEFINGILGTAGQGMSSGMTALIGAGAAGASMLAGKSWTNAANEGGEKLMNMGVRGAAWAAGSAVAGAVRNYSQSKGFDENGEKPE